MIADISVVEKSFGSKSLYSGLKFSVQAGEKVGVIGRNGVGKSTLFGILAGTDKDFTGDVIYKKGLSVIATRQEHHDVGHLSVLDYILHDLPEYSHLKHIMDTYPDTMGDDMRKIERYTEALNRFDHLGYYMVEDSILRELANFQLDEEKARGPLKNLSGGQKRLAEVVKIMHSQAQLALIDEPTNHMDYVAKDQFINWLKPAREAVLVITHDRDVLATVDRIIEIKDGKAFSYPGNYDAYLKQNTVSTTTKMHDYEVVQRQIANLRDKVTQFRRYKEKARDPDTIKQFKRREAQAAAELAELEKQKKPTFWIDQDSAQNLNYKVEEKYHKYKAKNINMNMGKNDSKSSHLLVELQKVSLGYGDTPLFEGLNMQLRERERVEFRGRNGAGKTTLAKAILAAGRGEKPSTILGGEIVVQPMLNIGVYEQEVNQNYFEMSLIDAIVQMHVDKGLPATREHAMRLMGNYLFNPSEDSGIKIKFLSGGQKARFQLMNMLATNPQLLILDEPTNHLDLPSIEELENALAKYSGALIYVSHDSYFRDKLGGEVLKVGAA